MVKVAGMDAEQVRERLAALANKEKAKVLRSFFKTGPGEYGEGDIFLGVTVPILRKLAKECRETRVTDALRLLRSPIHEERLLALFLLISLFTRGDTALKNRIYEHYLKNTRFVNNWDLVDLSAPNLVGAHLAERSRLPLYRLAGSKDLWERRIAIVATFFFIKANDLTATFKIAAILQDDEHDLIHKAVGWMLREAGKKDMRAEEAFLLRHYRAMPRTMLRYAIERFPEYKRLKYLNGTI
jgi:3-methyladenine DNA glycosylase AlkD